MITLKELSGLVEGKILSQNENADGTVSYAFSSDLMSDVLTVSEDNLLLITGLLNIQAIRTAEMADISYILFVRNKQPTTDMIELANESNIMLITSPFSMYRASGVLFQAGIKPLF